jgi:hypothetical protein
MMGSLNILIGCISYRLHTGSEMYFYELSSALRDMGHNVSILAIDAGSPLTDESKDITILNQDNIKDKEYDLVLFSHGSIIWDIIKNVNTKKFINIIHSEVIALEKPVINERISSYIAIRPTIVDYIKKVVPTGDIHLIYNPTDFKRFNKDMTKSPGGDKVVLFPGSLDYLRVKPVNFLLKMSEDQNFKVIHVGRNDYNIKHKNFETHPETNKIEEYYRQCDIVSGIFLGRTTIEGLLCGKRVLQFDVTSTGEILRVYWHTEDNFDKFDKVIIAKKIISI